MGRTGKPAMYFAVTLLMLVMVVKSVIDRPEIWRSSRSIVVSIFLSAAVSLTIVTIALIVQWRHTRRKR